MKFSIKDFFSKCDQIRSFLPIWSHLLKKSLMEKFSFCAVYPRANKSSYFSSVPYSANVSWLESQFIFKSWTFYNTK